MSTSTEQILASVAVLKTVSCNYLGTTIVGRYLYDQKYISLRHSEMGLKPRDSTTGSATPQLGDLWLAV